MKQKMTNVEQAWLGHQRKLFSFIRSKVETPEDAEDILNDIFTKLTKAYDENAVPDKISSWLYRVAKNRIVDYYRTKRIFDQLTENFSQESEDTNTIRQLSRCVPPMIQALSKTYQQPLMLSTIEGKKYKEIAVELNLSVAAVKSRILRGREKLRKSVVTCCTIYWNDKGETVGYKQKSDSFCTDCEY